MMALNPSKTMLMLASCALILALLLQATSALGNDNIRGSVATTTTQESLSAPNEIESSRDLATCAYDLKKLSHRQFRRWNVQDYILRDPSAKWSEEGSGPRRFKVIDKLPEPFRQSACIPKNTYRYLAWYVPGMPESGARGIAGCMGKFKHFWAYVPIFAVYDCNGNEITCGEGALRWTGKPGERKDYLIVMYASGIIPDRYWLEYGKKRVTRRYHCDIWDYDIDFSMKSAIRSNITVENINEASEDDTDAENESGEETNDDHEDDDEDDDDDKEDAGPAQ